MITLCLTFTPLFFQIRHFGGLLITTSTGQIRSLQSPGMCSTTTFNLSMAPAAEPIMWHWYMSSIEIGTTPCGDLQQRVSRSSPPNQTWCPWWSMHFFDAYKNTPQETMETRMLWFVPLTYFWTQDMMVAYFLMLSPPKHKMHALYLMKTNKYQ